MIESIAYDLTHPKRNISKAQTGWRLSFNPYCGDTQSAETAIILGETTSDPLFLILYGDHVDELDNKSRDEAVAYWQSRPECHGATSDTVEGHI